MTCSVCSQSFVVAAKEDIDLDPFSQTSVDVNMTEAHQGPQSLFSSHDAKTAVHTVPAGLRNRPSALDASTTAVDLPGRHESFGGSEFASRTAPYEVPRDARYDTRPDQRSAASLSGPDFLPRYDDDEEPATVADEDMMTIDDGEFEAIGDERTVEAEAPVPQRMPFEMSRAPTTVAQVPSLHAEPAREESKIHRLPFENPTHVETVVRGVPSLERPVNAGHAQGLQKVEIGAATFVGKIDPSLLKAAMASSEDTDAMMSGGLSADGTYTPPQELTRPAIVGYGGLVDEPLKTESRRLTRQVEPVSFDDRSRPNVSGPSLESSATTRFVRGATTVALSLTLLALGLFALVRSGQLDIEIFKDPELIVRKTGGVTGASGLQGVTPTSLRSLVYPTSRGASVLVFTGEVKNTGTEVVDNLDVVAELRDKDDHLVATAREPLGAVLTVAELASLDDSSSVERAFSAKHINGSIAASAQIPYMVVIAPAPSQALRTGHHLVRLVQRSVEAPVVTAPALQPHVEPVQELTDDEAMQLRKAKMKAKRMKMKRKALDDAEAASQPE